MSRRLSGKSSPMEQRIQQKVEDIKRHEKRVVCTCDFKSGECESDVAKDVRGVHNETCDGETRVEEVESDG